MPFLPGSYIVCMLRPDVVIVVVAAGVMHEVVVIAVASAGDVVAVVG